MSPSSPPRAAQHRHSAIDLRRLPPGATFLRILGVNYAHINTEDEGELYLTEHGVPFYEHLRPENWHDEQWFRTHRVPLAGTSTVYRVPTQPVPGHPCKSMELVVKWSRVGEDVPLTTFTLQQAIDAEFNSPFEEFALLEELRAGRYGPREVRILTQKPLAIYVPPGRMQPWQSGRSTHRLLLKLARNPGIEIDILRTYILIYGWIRGVDAVAAYGHFGPTERNERLRQLTCHVDRQLRAKGFYVADNKPSHFIVRPRETGPRRRRDGSPLYALVDYELLARTPEYDEAVRASARSRYLAMQRDRFRSDIERDWPEDLHEMEVLGVPYVYGRTESTAGTLWVVGRDPELFNYFLPERWRAGRVALSTSNRTFYTRTKDRIHLVWTISRVGQIPPGAMGDPAYGPVLRHGFNSPFEEVELALAMRRAGIGTTYPRAIYMTHQLEETRGLVLDDRRFTRAARLTTPDGLPLMPMEHEYVILWGYFRGLEDDEAIADSGYWTPIDLERAAEKGLISAAEHDEALARHRETLRAAGFEDLCLSGGHVLLTYIPPGTIRRNGHQQIALWHCNFEMVRRLPTTG